jgi:hypothetical protein
MCQFRRDHRRVELLAMGPLSGLVLLYWRHHSIVSNRRDPNELVGLLVPSEPVTGIVKDWDIIVECA